MAAEAAGGRARNADGHVMEPPSLRPAYPPWEPHALPPRWARDSQGRSRHTQARVGRHNTARCFGLT